MKKNKAKLFDIKHFPMDIGRSICFWMPWWFRSKKVYMTERAKQKVKGGAVLVANHTCFADPLMVGCAVWYRRMFFLAAEVVMRNKLVGLLLRGIGCIKIDRNICDMNAIRKTVSILKEGHVLSVFPQGGISREDNMQTIKSGVVLMAMQAKVPIIPMYVHKKDKTCKRNYVVIGEPITDHIPQEGSMLPLAAVQSAADKILREMTACKNKFEEISGGKN